MSLTTLIIIISIAAAILTAAIVYTKKHKNILMSFLQNFCGVWFIISGAVKVVDPLGTAFKMENYFEEFYVTFNDSFLSFLAPIFPMMGEYSIVFSVFMIVLEIILGIMLIIGFLPRLTAWLFFLIMIFFTILTGFTHLTGYVPAGANFFDFSQWAEFNPANRKVQDCGCFGDFIKLEPLTSFYKDIFLMIPALFFLFRSKWMHQLFGSGARWLLTILSTLVVTIYALSNYVWDLPQVDFRPFSIGKDVAKTKDAEMQAAADVEVIAYKLQKEGSSQVVELPKDEYFAALKNKEYTKDQGWKVLDYVMTEPKVKETKISNFDIYDFNDDDVTERYLSNPEYRFMILTYKSYSKTVPKKEMRRDTFYSIDTLVSVENDTTFSKSISDIKSKEITVNDYVWDSGYKNDFINIVTPLVESARKDGVKTGIVFGSLASEAVDDFKSEVKINADMETADEILLKTIIRSNPGILLWKDGRIVMKWHKDRLPSYQEIKEKYMK